MSRKSKCGIVCYPMVQCNIMASKVHEKSSYLGQV